MCKHLLDGGGNSARLQAEEGRNYPELPPCLFGPGHEGRSQAAAIWPARNTGADEYGRELGVLGSCSVSPFLDKPCRLSLTFQLLISCPAWEFLLYGLYH